MLLGLVQYKHIMEGLTTSHVSYTHPIISGIGISKQYYQTVKEIITKEFSFKQYGFQSGIKEEIFGDLDARHSETTDREKE